MTQQDQFPAPQDDLSAEELHDYLTKVFAIYADKGNTLPWRGKTALSLETLTYTVGLIEHLWERKLPDGQWTPVTQTHRGDMPQPL